jgi:outer membrane beta-barrel protein
MISVVFSRSIIFLFVCLLGFASWAEEVAIPDSELSKEVSYPLLDTPRAVVNRILTFTNRVEVEFGPSWILDEPFYQNQSFDLGIFFHWSEFSGVGLRYMHWATGLSDYAKQFGKGTNPLDLNRSNGPENGYSAEYEYRLFYGKISVGKETVFPISIRATGELGMISYGVKTLPFAAAGIGNRFFFNRNFGINADMKVMYRDAIDPVSANLTGSGTVPARSDFSSKYRLNMGLNLGVLYLF